jgi:tetratricopeptide (TPR) repeat protein
MGSAPDESRNVTVGLNRVEELVQAGNLAQAAELARRLLTDLERQTDRAEKDKADKHPQARWRLYTVLAEGTGALNYYYEAALACPDLPVARAALGCALARAGQFPEAVTHLCRAVAGDPFDLPAARALFGALGAVGDAAGQRRLARARRRLHEVDPEHVPNEPWFDQAVRPRVSLCMIVKNEEDNLPACLDSTAGLCDETVVVDTGSADRTKEIAARYGAHVVDFAWVESFAAARNESVRHATGSWIFWMDADDRLDEENRARLRSLFDGLADDNAAYVMKCLCLPEQPGSASHNGPPRTGAQRHDAATVVDHVRLFRNDPQVRWHYRVHEQILPALRRLRADVRWTDVVIHHIGYQNSGLRGRKLERDLRLLGLDNAEHPNDPFTLFNLGSVYQELRRPAEALPLLYRSLELSQPADSIVRKLHALIAQCHRQLGQLPEALAACRAGRGHYPDDAELLFMEGLTLREQGDRAGAEAAWLRLASGHEDAHFASVDAGLRGPKVRHNLAVLYQEQGRRAEAEGQWRAVVAAQPDYLPGWLGLAEIYLAEQRDSSLDEVQMRLEAVPHGSLDAAILRARRHLLEKEYASARQILDTAIAQAPQALFPRVILSHVLLQEAADWDAAERALRDVLELDPGNAEAQANLDVLLKQGAARLPVSRLNTNLAGPLPGLSAKLNSRGS